MSIEIANIDESKTCHGEVKVKFIDITPRDLEVVRLKQVGDSYIADGEKFKFQNSIVKSNPTSIGYDVLNKNFKSANPSISGFAKDFWFRVQTVCAPSEVPYCSVEFKLASKKLTTSSSSTGHPSVLSSNTNSGTVDVSSPPSSTTAPVNSSKTQGQMPQLPNPYNPEKNIPVKCLCSSATWNSETNKFEYKEMKSKPISQLDCRVLRLFREYEDMFLKQWKEDLMNGICFQGKEFHGLAFSNSGQKCGSVLFLNKNSEFDRESISKLLGDFTPLETVGKLAKRVGASFGTTKVLPVRILESDYAEIDDIVTNGYEISDGCGLISSLKMDELLKPLFPETYSTISAIQIRFLGYKGLLVRYSDKFIKQLAVKNECSKKDTVTILFRKSMNKFTVPVLEYSNDQQDSEDQKDQKYKFVCDSFSRLVRREIEVQEKYLKSCRHAMRLFNDEQPIHFALRYALLSCGNAKDILEEPFIYKSIVEAVLKNFWGQFISGKIRISDPQLVYLMGAVDETKKLKADEVYVSFGNGEYPTVLTQTVLIGKHPCVMASDIRKVKAVYCQELSHLRNVVIFSSQINNRPLADQCSGADFDGDRFFIIHNPNFVEVFEQEEEVCAYGDKLREELKQQGEIFKEIENNPNESIAGRIFDQLILHTKYSNLGTFEHNAKIHYEQNRNMKHGEYQKFAKKCAMELEGCLFADKPGFVFNQNQIDGNWLRFRYEYKDRKTFDTRMEAIKAFCNREQCGDQKKSLIDIIFEQLVCYVQNLARKYDTKNSKNSKFVSSCDTHFGELYKSLYDEYTKQAAECLSTYNYEIAQKLKAQKGVVDEQESCLENDDYEEYDSEPILQEEKESKQFDYSYDHMFPPNSIERQLREKYFNLEKEDKERLKLKAAIFYLHTIAQQTTGSYIMPWKICFDFLVRARIDIENKKNNANQEYILPLVRKRILPLVLVPNHIDLISKHH